MIRTDALRDAWERSRPGQSPSGQLTSLSASYVAERVEQRYGPLLTLLGLPVDPLLDVVLDDLSRSAEHPLPALTSFAAYLDFLVGQPRLHAIVARWLRTNVDERSARRLLGDQTYVQLVSRYETAAEQDPRVRSVLDEGHALAVLGRHADALVAAWNPAAADRYVAQATRIALSGAPD